MNKRLFLISILLAGASSALAQQTKDQTISSLMGTGMPGELSTQVAQILDGKADSSGNTEIISLAGKSIELLPENSAATGLKIRQSGGDSTIISFGDGTPTRAHLDIRGSTTDGNDDGYIIIGPGGANNLERGSAIVMYANETTGGNHGDLKLDCGNVVGGDVEIITPETLGVTNTYRRRFYWSAHSGNMFSDADYGGDLVFQKSGSGLSIQEATGATACMGAATPNGTTPVTVTTSCATTGSRVFYSRTGAITNMGVITTTTASNGTSFAFASTGASDTLASSVIWMIIKESA